MITPFSHFKNIPINIIFPEVNNIGKQLLRIFVVNYDAESMLFYSGKILELHGDNLQQPLVGKFVIDVNGLTYILLNEPLTYQVFANASVVYNTTFKIGADNEAITEADLLSKYNKQIDNFIFDGKELLGTYGLLSPQGSSKLKTIKNTESYNFGFTFENLTAYQFIGAIKVDFVGGVFNHKFGIIGNIANVSWELSIPESDTTNLSINVSHYGCSLNCGFTLRFSYITHTNGDKYILIEALIDSVPIGQTNPIHNIWHTTINRSNVLTSNTDIANIDFIYSTKSVEPVTFGTEINVFKFDKYLKSYNKLEPILYLPRDINIPDNTNLNTLVSLANYFATQLQVIGLTNKPVGILRSFRLEIKPIYFSSSSYTVIQTIYTYGTDNKPLIFNRVISNTFAGTWENINEHKVDAGNVNTNETHKFVTQTQIDNWNAISTELSWKNPVQTIAQLSIVYPQATQGCAAYVLDQNMVHVFDGLQWLPQIRTVGDNNNGVITTSMYREFFLQPSNSKKVLNKENTYCHRLSILSDIEKEFYSDYVLDLVPRNELNKQIEQNTIGIGFGITTAYGQSSIAIGNNVVANKMHSYLIGENLMSDFDNSIGIGTGLKFTDFKTIAIGQFNLGENENVFEIGNGSSDTTRSNLFSITRAGILKLVGFKLPNGTNNDILLADGSFKSLENIISTIVEGIASTVTLFKEVPVSDQVSGKYTLPWTETEVALYGRMGTFEIYQYDEISLKWSKQEVPISTSLISTPNLLDPLYNDYTASEYVFDLSGLLSIIIIK